MRKQVLAILGATAVIAQLTGGPAEKLDPVAANYPVWTGLTAKNRVCGRVLCPSDLRHRITVVVEIEPNEKLHDQLLQVAPLISGTGLANVGLAPNWEDLELPRHSVVVVSNRGKRDSAAIEAALKSKDGEQSTSAQMASIVRGYAGAVYDDVTFDGAPDAGGKRPFLYVMGPTGKEPICKGPLNDATVKEALAAIAKAKKAMSAWDPAWQPFVGTLPADKLPPTLVKALEKGRSGKSSPLDPVAKGVLKGVLSKDEEKATEAQILFDAINQTRSDLIVRIRMEAQTCPHRAYYDIQELLRYWPTEKKRVDGILSKIKGSELEPLAKAFCKVMDWSRPDYVCKNAAEVKKNLMELNKMKKSLSGAKESKTILIQNSALTIDTKIDELISQMPSKLPAK